MAAHRQLAVVLALCVLMALGNVEARGRTRAQQAQVDAALKRVAASLTKASSSAIEVKAGASYVAPNCSALADVAALFTAAHADSTLKTFAKVTIQLPCTAGTVKVGKETVSFGTPDYTCVDSAGKSIVAGFFTEKRTGSVTITAMTKGGGCVLPGGKTPAVVPVLTGGAAPDEYGNELQFLTFGSNYSLTPTDTLKSPNLLTATLTGIRINAGNLRPAIGAYNAKALIIKSGSVRFAYSRYLGSVIDAYDTTVTWTGAKDFDTVDNNFAVGFGPEITGLFPGAGGVFAVTQDLLAAPLTVSNVAFSNNSHSNFGGIYYARKYTALATKVTFKNVKFNANSAGVFPVKAPEGAGGCALGLTYREDGAINTDKDPAVNVTGKPFTVSITPFGGAWGTNVGSLGPINSLYLCGVFSFGIPGQIANTTIPMPIDLVKGSSKVVQKGLTSALSSAFPAGTPILNNTVGVEYAFIKA